MKKLRRKLKDMKVGKKLLMSYSVILVAMVIALIIAIGGITMINGQVKTFYNESYENTRLQLEIKKDIQMVGKYVLWALTTEDSATVFAKVTSAENYTKNTGKNVEALKENFPDQEMVTTLENAMQDLQTAQTEVLALASDYKTEEALALFNGDYDTATKAVEKALNQIGDFAEGQAEAAYKQSRVFGIVVEILMLITGVISVVICMILGKMITSGIKEPIVELEKAAEKLKNGELNIDISYESHDEMGQLAENFRTACLRMNEVVKDAGYQLGEMAEGNFDITFEDEKYVGDFGLLIESMNTLNRQLNDTLIQINEASDQVAVGSEQMAESAQALAEGATEQASAVEELTATVESVTDISEEGARGATMAAQIISQTEKEALESRDEMQKLTNAMDRITETSRQIEEIIGAIEDIADQTNLLSLNASIEAARAGEAGRGFAVVADQIGKLAADSAQSAVTTRELIGKSLLEIEEGNELAKHTAEVIEKVLESMSQIAVAAAESAAGSRTQADMLKQVEAGIEQITVVIQNNSASAEESSAVSQELSAQATTLKEKVGEFRLHQN